MSRHFLQFKYILPTRACSNNISLTKLLTLIFLGSKIRHVSNEHNARLTLLVTSVNIVIIIIIVTLFDFIALKPCPALSAAPQSLKWTRVDIPMEGAAGGWVLADGSDIQHLTAAADGTLYAYGKGLPCTLYKSTDRGLKWSSIGNVQDEITDIAVSLHDANTIYYSTVTAVYRSTDGGKTFLALPAEPGGAGANNKIITSLAATWLNNNIVAVGIRDTDIGEYGGVYLFNEGDIVPAWTDSNIGNLDVYAVAFSPNYSGDRQVVAVVTDETDTFIYNQIGNADWNAFIGPARLNQDNSEPPVAVAVAEGTLLSFPADYYADTASDNNFFFVGIDTGAGIGDVYKITCVDAPGESLAADLNCGRAYGEINTDITGLAVYFDSQYSILLAGAADSSHIYISTDGGISWGKSKKVPTGDSYTEVLVAPNFTTTGLIYAASSGDGSALSISRDTGLTWNQISFIDTAVTSIIDFAPSPDFSVSDAIFMITFGSGHSLWRSMDDGATWERIFSSDSSGIDTLALVGLPPQYGNESQTVFAVGESNSRPALWESKDNGQSFQCRFTCEPVTGAAFSIDVWAIIDENTLYAGSFNGSQGKIYQTTNSGLNFSEGGTAGTDSLYSLAVSPDFDNDGTIMVGNSDGGVYYSSDNGSSFQTLPFFAAAPPLTGFISVAFDYDFKTNQTVYAASSTAGSGLYRFVIGQSDAWESIDGAMPGGAEIKYLTASNNGVLYAVNYTTDGGMERCLNPTTTSGATFETVTLGLSSGATLSGLWQSNARLWTIDNHNINDDKLMTYYDTLTSPAVQVAPENGMSGIGSLVDHTVRNVTIDWETMDGATNYEWQCTYDTDFSTIPAGFNGTTQASSIRLPALEPATTYHWRVRACAPVYSPWSPKRSFTTSMDTEGVDLKPEMPAAGAEGVSVRPVFQWSVVVGAEAYELLVATDADFSHPVIVKMNEYALKTNVWQCDINLDYATTYYWKIRATTASTTSAWSSASVFITESAPVIDETLPAGEPEIPSTGNNTIMSLSSSKSIRSIPSSPAPEQSALLDISGPATSPAATTIINQLSDMPGWLIYLLGGLFGIVFLALMIVLIIVIKIKRV